MCLRNPMYFLSLKINNLYIFVYVFRFDFLNRRDFFLCMTPRTFLLLQLLNELEHSGVNKNKEHSAKLLGHLIATAPALMRSYSEPILRVRYKECRYFCLVWNYQMF